MFFPSQEEKFHLNQKKIKELSIRSQALNREIETFYEELETSPEALAAFSRLQENFEPAAWEILERARASSPTPQQKARPLPRIAPHWIPVR